MVYTLPSLCKSRLDITCSLISLAAFAPAGRPTYSVAALYTKLSFRGVDMTVLQAQEVSQTIAPTTPVDPEPGGLLIGRVNM